MKSKFSLFSVISLVFVIAVLNFNMVFADAPGGGTDPQCDSGGPGATSCTITYAAGGGGGGVSGNGEISCSVEVGAGYYACCYISSSFPFVHCVPKSNGGQTG